MLIFCLESINFDYVLFKLSAMICLVPSRPTIRLFLVIALSLMLSCVTAPGVRTSDVAELHYGDLEDAYPKKHCNCHQLH